MRTVSGDRTLKLSWEWVPNALADSGANQADLARVWNTSRGSVSRFCAGAEGQDPPVSRLVRLAQLLGAPYDDIMRRVLAPAGAAHIRSTGVAPVGCEPIRSLGEPGAEMSSIGPGRVRLRLVADLSLAEAIAIINRALPDAA